MSNKELPLLPPMTGTMKLFFAFSLFVAYSLANEEEGHGHLRARHLNSDTGIILYGHENGCIVPKCLGNECGAFFASCEYPADSNTNTHWYQDSAGLLHSGSDDVCLQAAWGNVVNDGSKVRFASCDANKATQQFETVTPSGKIKLKMRSDLCLIAQGNPPIKDVSQIILKNCGVVGDRAIWRALDVPVTGVTVAVYYYPWYGNNFHGGKYLRHDLEMRQPPVLGEYDDSDPSVIAKHLEWSKDANIRAWVTSWWGPDSYEDKTIRNVILPHSDIGDLKIAIHYESTGRGRNSTGQLDETLILERADSDITHLCQHYFSHPNYMRIRGKPVIVFYLSRYYESAPELQPGLMRETSRVMKEAARNCGESGIYLIGDHAFNDILLPLDYLDAITNYDVYGSIQAYSNGEYYAKQTGMNQYVAMQDNWRGHAKQEGKGFIPAASPGFNDRSVRLEADHVPLSRKLSPDAPFGSLFEESLKTAMDMVDPSTGNMLLINSWNEWHEDTQIEPVIGFSSSGPSHLTKDVEYEGYAFRYLDILRKYTL